ncbi:MULTISPECIES: glycosyltransferase 87 family protein [unclassified Rubrivivax]|uniref:glycosyltransferase 87 family protein n=1 Tax=unclassified Rubrivivax TaxID=2649762 RepID=UPI001E5EF49F|nr:MULTISPECIES: glycosyltransferase 87 family protein [unclassified Rubrivivax]MCC9596679.1 DUF2029 domain-containing protein [Rubrivivax sp. JA1055]MCC9648836.1 DUF2029 domain-containing protein [Rubrivivax sp. JA1029]
MSSLLQTLPGRDARAPEQAVRPASLEFGLVLVTCAVLAVAVSYAMGRDLNWDFFNYHGYDAFDPFGARLGQDFFPAGYQAYLYRLAFLPFSLMDAAGWHSLAIGSVLAALHSLNVAFLYLVVREFVRDVPRPRFVAAAVTALGAAALPFIGQIGSTFIDPLATPLVMAALWVLLRAGRSRGNSAPAVAGVLGGLAVALKLTNVPFAIGLVAAAAVLPGWTLAWRRAAVAALATGLGFALLYLPWGWKLWSLHGSPVFPLFNNVFGSPDFPAYPIELHRFVPQTLEQLLTLPVAMLQHSSYVYVEQVAPDLRPAVLLVLASAAVVLHAVRRTRGVPLALATRQPAPTAPLVAFVVVSTAVWVLTSTNGRYAVPLLLLLAPLIYVAGAALFGERRAAMLCLVLWVLQMVQIVDTGNPRWSPRDWAPRWLSAQVPERLQREPHLFVSISSSSESYVAAHVHPDSVFVNPIGLLSIPNDGPGWSRYTALRDRFAARTTIIFPVPADIPEEKTRLRLARLQGAVDRLGLTFEPSRCEALRFGQADGAIPYLWRGPTGQPGVSLDRQVFACDATRLATPSAEQAAAREQASRIMDALERKCPAVFSPNGVQVEGSGDIWTRLYGKYDLFVNVNFARGDIVYVQERQSTDVPIGRVETWQQDIERFRCRLPHDGARDISTLDGDR